VTSELLFHSTGHQKDMQSFYNQFQVQV